MSAGFGYYCQLCREPHNPFDLCPSMNRHQGLVDIRRNLLTHPEHPITMHEPCAKAPPGWRCQRAAGHEGPCAAVHDSMEEDAAQLRFDRVRVAAEKAVRDWAAYSRQPDGPGWEKHRASMQALEKQLLA